MFSSGILRSRACPPRKLVVPPIRKFSSTFERASGHNKWSKIKQRKEIEDAKKSKLYGKASRDIITAAKSSTSPEENGLLAAAIRRAKDAGVPKENIENALAKAERSKEGGQPLTFEAMINGTTGLIIECRSDNVNRTVKSINHVLSLHRAHPTPVKFMFQQRGYVKVQIGDDMERLLDQVMNVCSIDFADWSEEETGQRGVEVSLSTFLLGITNASVQLVCRPEDLYKLTKVIQDYAATSPGCEILASEVNWAPLQPQEVEEHEKSRVADLIDNLEDDADFERVFTTLEPNRLIVDF
ncbi:YebC-like protein [Phlebopus sp. FC_14]|nr:YebC-like protein [Phlebopus sp. FC_14]